MRINIILAIHYAKVEASLCVVRHCRDAALDDAFQVVVPAKNVASARVRRWGAYRDNVL